MLRDCEAYTGRVLPTDRYFDQEKTSPAWVFHFLCLFVAHPANDALVASFFTPHHYSTQGIALRFLFLLLFWLIGSFQDSGLVLEQCHKQADDCGGVVCMITLPMLWLKERSWWDLIAVNLTRCDLTFFGVVLANSIGRETGTPMHALCCSPLPLGLTEHLAWLVGLDNGWFIQPKEDWLCLARDTLTANCDLRLQRFDETSRIQKRGVENGGKSEKKDNGNCASKAARRYSYPSQLGHTCSTK